MILEVFKWDRMGVSDWGKIKVWSTLQSYIHLIFKCYGMMLVTRKMRKMRGFVIIFKDGVLRIARGTGNCDKRAM